MNTAGSVGPWSRFARAPLTLRAYVVFVLVAFALSLSTFYAPSLDLKQANPERFCGRFFKVCDGATRAGRRFSGVCEWGVVLSDRVLVVVFLR
jgi:hypothetical protein